MNVRVLRLIAVVLWLCSSGVAWASPQGGADASAERVDAPQASTNAAIVEALTARIEAMRAQVLTRQLEKLDAKSEVRFELMSEALGWFSLSGLLLLLLPLWLRRRYPGKLRALFGYSALAAATFVATMLLFSVLVLTFKMIQSGLATITNPALQLTNGAFDALTENVGLVVDAAPALIELPLAQLESGVADGVSMALLQNAASLAQDAGTFLDLAHALSWVKDVLGLLPIILALLVVILFLMSLKEVVVALVTLPQRALDGEATAGQTLKLVGGRLWAESLVTLLVLLAFTVVTIASALAMTATAAPAADALVGYTMLNTVYLVAVPDASTALVYASVGGALVFVVLALVSMVLASVLYLSKLQKVLHARLVSGVSLRANARFFKLGTLALLWALVLPFLFIVGAEWLADVLTGADSAEPDWGVLLGSAPLLLVVGFLVVYWLLRGIRAQRFLLKYKVVGPSEPVASAP